MSLFDGVRGNGSKLDSPKILDEFERILAPEEQVEHLYQLIRDYLVFTNKRLVLMDKQRLTGNKVDYHSIPYRSISHFSVETAGTFDIDAELRLWISSAPTPIQRHLSDKVDVYELQSLLASYVLR